jgi:hypothetical protein
MITAPLCLVMEDEFDTFDTKNTWRQEVDMSGFGYVDVSLRFMPGGLLTDRP